MRAAEDIALSQLKVQYEVLGLLGEHETPGLIASMLAEGESLRVYPDTEWVSFRVGDVLVGRVPVEKVELHEE